MATINKTKSIKSEEIKEEFVLSRNNYILLATGFLVIVIGYFLISGGKTEDPTIFNPEVYSFRRITLAPIVIFIGFVIETVAIMWKFPKKENN